MKTIQSEHYSIHIGNDSFPELSNYLSEKKYSSVFILTDENTKKHCLPIFKKISGLRHQASVIQIKSGEKNKNLSTCEKIWKALSNANAGRNSVLLNLGGGTITDLGGFCASTYKRGIDFINIPTTLLAQVDASVGGKTGIDFYNFKNQIGTFAFPKAVCVNPVFLKTLMERELLSGYAEVLKHGLIADRSYWKELLSSSPENFRKEKGERLIRHSIAIKNNIVASDPFEKGLRKALNFGHTIGHAVESASMKSKKHLLHGEAVAIGMICETYLSRKCCGLSSEELQESASLIISVFHPEKIKHSPQELIRLMQQDKKNREAEINFTLLSSIGKAEINNSCTNELIEESLRYYDGLVS